MTSERYLQPLEYTQFFHFGRIFLEERANVREISNVHLLRIDAFYPRSWSIPALGLLPWVAPCELAWPRDTDLNVITTEEIPFATVHCSEQPRSMTANDTFY